MNINSARAKTNMLLDVTGFQLSKTLEINIGLFEQLRWGHLGNFLITADKLQRPLKVM